MSDTHFDQSGQTVHGPQYNIGGDLHIHEAPQAPNPVAILQTALDKLAELPLNILPDHAPLPKGSLLPFPSNAQFVGRQDQLKQLAQLLTDEQATAIGQTAAATGMGGIGKSQLANEFAHRYGQYFSGGVFWISLA